MRAMAALTPGLITKIGIDTQLRTSATLTFQGLMLTEIALGFDLVKDIFGQMVLSLSYPQT
jgi:acyl CoA:acetate/3-ketoacid CoA transferase